MAKAVVVSPKSCDLPWSMTRQILTLLLGSQWPICWYCISCGRCYKYTDCLEKLPNSTRCHHWWNSNEVSERWMLFLQFSLSLKMLSNYFLKFQIIFHKISKNILADKALFFSSWNLLIDLPLPVGINLLNSF